jgi:hypothetical protein
MCPGLATFCPLSGRNIGNQIAHSALQLEPPAIIMYRHAHPAWVKFDVYRHLGGAECSVLQLVELIGQLIQPVLHFRLVAQTAGLIDHGQGFDHLLGVLRLHLAAFQ